MSRYIPVEPEKWAEMVKAMAEVTRLKAEVERLQNNCDYLDRELDREIDKTAMLCGHVERLRKAGDAMARIIAPPTHGTGEWDGEWEAWNAAKEGKVDVDKVEIDDETFERENKAYKEARAKEGKGQP